MTNKFERSDLEAFLEEYPLSSGWLEDIIAFLMTEPRGAHVTKIADRLHGRHYGKAMEATVTRTINNYCSDAADFDGGADSDLFERVKPAVYRLRSHPHRPQMPTFKQPKFIDDAMQSTWSDFTNIARKKLGDKWSTATHRQKLTAFVNNFESARLRQRYHSYTSMHHEIGDMLKTN